jgi:YD repeat-containing protein
MNEIKEYDKNGNLIHYRDSDGWEWWSEYDENNNEIHYRNSNTGVEWWSKYDENNNEIHYRNSNGVESWHDEEGNEIEKPTTPTQEHTMQIADTFTLIADYPDHAELTLSIPADCGASDFLRHCKTLAIGMGYHHTNWDDAILELAEEIQHMKKTA